MNPARFGLSDMLPIGITFAVVGIALAFALQVTGDVRDDMGTESCAARSDTFTLYNSTSDLCYNSSGTTASVTDAYFNATTDSTTGLSNITGKLPTIALVVVAALIIGILVRNFMTKR